MSRLSFHDVHKSFRGVKALRGVGFSVEAGEAHAIVGENGAGKSTLLRILSGSLAPDQGLAAPGRRAGAPVRAARRARTPRSTASRPWVRPS